MRLLRQRDKSVILTGALVYGRRYQGRRTCPMRTRRMRRLESYAVAYTRRRAVQLDEAVVRRFPCRREWHRQTRWWQR